MIGYSRVEGQSDGADGLNLGAVSGHLSTSLNLGLLGRFSRTAIPCSRCWALQEI